MDALIKFSKHEMFLNVEKRVDIVWCQHSKNCLISLYLELCCIAYAKCWDTDLKAELCGD